MNDNLIKSETLFRSGAWQNDIRKPKGHIVKLFNRYDVSADYVEPISDSAKVSVSMGYNTSYNRNSRDVNDFNSATGDYSKFNVDLSNMMRQQNNGILYRVGYERIRKTLIYGHLPTLMSRRWMLMPL